MTTQEVLNLNKGDELVLLPIDLCAAQQGMTRFHVKSVKTMKTGQVKIYPQEKFCLSITEQAFSRLRKVG